MRKDDVVHLQHMLDAGREALGFARSRCRSDLDGDRMLVLALVKDVEIIGLDVLWQTVQQDLAPLVTALEEALKMR
ncbi:MAG: hypothetical protein FJX73_11110 [Armatimonadetes bacterium]|nr:hypothetical protein [Armatimonadota bacterium]